MINDTAILNIKIRSSQYSDASMVKITASGSTYGGRRTPFTLSLNLKKSYLPTTQHPLGGKMSGRVGVAVVPSRYDDNHRAMMGASVSRCARLVCK